MKKLNLIENVNTSKNLNIQESQIAESFIDRICDRELREATNGIFHINSSGPFKNKAIYLSSSYNYELGEDINGGTILVAILNDI